MSTYFESAIISSSINWTQSDRDQGNTVILDQGQFESQSLFQNGTGVDQANLVWHTTGVLSGNGSNVTIDLMNLTRRVLNGDITINLSGGKVKGLMVKYTSGTTGVDYLRIAFRDVSSPFNEFFDSTDTNYYVASGQSFILSNPFGFNVSSTYRRFLLSNDYGNIIGYEIAVIGSK